MVRCNTYFCLRLLGVTPKVLGVTKTPHPGEGLKVMRVNAGLTQYRLASLARVSRAMISQVERGVKNPTGRWMRDVSEAIGRHLAGGES